VEVGDDRLHVLKIDFQEDGSMTWRTYAQPDGTMELADWPYRRDAGWLNVNWIMTHRCELGCPYCIGWKRGADAPRTLLDEYGPAGLVDRLERLRESAGKGIYLTISGGEPTHEPGLPAMCAELTRRGFVIELQTNLTTEEFPAWAEAVAPAGVAQVMASYHAWAFKRDPALLARYRANFALAAKLGLSPVAKRVVLPREADDPASVLRSVTAGLPLGSPVLLWLYIHGKPTSPGGMSNAYPYAYSRTQKDALNAVRKYRRNCQRWYQEGAGPFRGMRCDAGRCFVYADVAGKVWRCFTAGGRHQVGDLREGRIEVDARAKPCPYPYCSTPFWGLWYGVDPWRYVEGMPRAGATFCRNYPKES
jgi:hypothetical protein